MNQSQKKSPSISNKGEIAASNCQKVTEANKVKKERRGKPTGNLGI